MICLPSPQTGLHLPLNDTSASEIAAILLGDDATTVANWTALLAADPIVLLWVAAHHARLGQEQPQDMASLAQWVAPKALALLDWSNTDVASRDTAFDASTWREIVRATVAQVSMDCASEDIAWDEHRDFMLKMLSAVAESIRAAELPLANKTLGGWLTRAIKPSGDRTAADTDDAANAAEIKRYVRRWPARESGTRNALPELTDRLRRLRDLESDFEQTLRREKLAAMRELAYGASHEINNPLANISTRAQSLLRDEPDPERRRMLSTIHLQAMRAHEMIANLMHFAKPPTQDRELVNLAECVAEIVDELAEWSRDQGTAVETSCPADPCFAEVDRGQLMVALRALVRNSLEALAAGGKIEVDLEVRPADTDSPEAANQVVIRVRDNGPGIAADAMPHIFDPFYSGREAGRGLGFGLAWCWRIIEQHGGHIEVDSREGHGAEFRIVLPGHLTS